MCRYGIELVRGLQSMESWMSDNVEPFLIPSSKSWQPSDYLPDPASAEFPDAIRALRKECGNLPPEYLVVLVGDMVTEEALPSYISMLNRMDGCKDNTGQPLPYRHPCCTITRFGTCSADLRGEW